MIDATCDENEFNPQSRKGIAQHMLGVGGLITWLAANLMMMQRSLHWSQPPRTTARVQVAVMDVNGCVNCNPLPPNQFHDAHANGRLHGHTYALYIHKYAAMRT